jgi:hypothetical protein
MSRFEMADLVIASASEAIQDHASRLDCFVALHLAMTTADRRCG